jgi:hypothetical protein
MWIAHHQGRHKGKTQSMILLVDMFCHFVKNIFEPECSIKNSTFKLKSLPKNNQKSQNWSQLPT